MIDQKKSKKFIMLFVFIVFFDCALGPFLAFAANSFKEGNHALTLWELLQSGGWIMIFLGLMSIVAVALIVYNFRTINPELISSRKFADEIIGKLQKRDFKSVQNMCAPQQNILARIMKAGMEMKDKGTGSVTEVMETVARQEIGILWQNINYLADIGSIAPLVGLLGAVLGMIQAFNIFVYQTAGVKPAMLVGGVSKAMVSTAGGLFIAIPVLIFYSYFKGRLLTITNVIESSSTEIIKMMETHDAK